MSTDPKMYEFLKNLNAEIKKWILPETEMKLVEVRVMTAKSSVQELSEVWSSVVRQRTLVSNSVTHLKLIMSNIRGVINVSIPHYSTIYCSCPIPCELLLVLPCLQQKIEFKKPSMLVLSELLSMIL